MKLSVIIPVYNSARYLASCLDSILEQKIESEDELEILLIDNGSSDNSVEIIEKYQKRFLRIIKFAICGQAGAAAVRNFGLKKASGDVVWYVDSDDMVAKKSLMRIFEKFNSSDLDLVVVSVERVYKERSKNSVLKAIDVNAKDWQDKFVMYGFGPWQVVAKRKFLLNNELFFPEGMIHEDMALMSAYILFTEKVGAISEIMYYYFQRGGSVLHQEKWNPSCLDIFLALEILYKKFEAEKMAKKYQAALEYFFIWNLLLDSAADFRRFKEGRVGFKMSRELLKRYFKNWRKKEYFKRKGLKMKLKCYLGYLGI